MNKVLTQKHTRNFTKKLWYSLKETVTSYTTHNTFKKKKSIKTLNGKNFIYYYSMVFLKIKTNKQLYFSNVT